MRILKVLGLGSAQAEPDTATLSLDIVGKAVDYATAMAQLNSTTEQFKQALTEAQLPMISLKTTDFSINTETKYEDGQSIDIGFRAAHCMNIVLNNDKVLLNQLIEVITHSQSNAQFRVSFSLKDNEHLHQQALTRAVENARTNAEIIAAAAAVSLGQILEIRYGDLSEPASHIYGGTREIAMYAKADLDPQDIQVQESVLMIFELLG